jgi:hypothetical protein
MSLAPTRSCTIGNTIVSDIPVVIYHSFVYVEQYVHCLTLSAVDNLTSNILAATHTHTRTLVCYQESSFDVQLSIFHVPVFFY